jgi:hypothetical protein
MPVNVVCSLLPEPAEPHGVVHSFEHCRHKRSVKQLYPTEFNITSSSSTSSQSFRVIILPLCNAVLLKIKS